MGERRGADHIDLAVSRDALLSWNRKCLLASSAPPPLLPPGWGTGGRKGGGTVAAPPFPPRIGGKGGRGKKGAASSAAVRLRIDAVLAHQLFALVLAHGVLQRAERQRGAARTDLHRLLPEHLLQRPVVQLGDVLQARVAAFLLVEHLHQDTGRGLANRAALAREMDVLNVLL